MVWNDETILRLRELWEQGHSTAEIGRRLGVSKNAIVGKAHRLDLTARPSPIRRDPSERTHDRPASTVRVGGPTLPPLPSALGPASPAQTNIQPMRSPPAPRPVAAAAPPQVAPPVRAAAAAPYRRAAPSCCWPIGEPGKKDFRFCDDMSVPGKPYCDEHAKVAYVKIRDRKEDAA